MKAYGILLAALLAAFPVSAQTRPAQTQKSASTYSGFRGDGFFDYYYNVANPSSYLKGQNGFDMRRLTLGYQLGFTKNVLAYSELEAKNSDAPTGKYSVYVKQAFVEVKNVLPQMRLVMGLSPTPAVVTSERLWGYRMLQALPLEYYGLAPTVDNGIAAKGKIDPDGLLSYHVMVGNGSGLFVETDKIKRLYASVGLTPTPGLVLEAYGDFENAGNARYHATFKGLVGYEGTSFTVGLEGIYRINHHTVTQWYDESPYAISLYGWMLADDGIRLVYRGDFYDFDQNKKSYGVQTIAATLGLDYMPVPDVHIVPNIMYTSYINKVASAVKPDDALTVRLTAAFVLSGLR
jgi:hypothetical protein